MRISDLSKILNATLIGSDCEFQELSTDSRNIAKGGLFVALRGEYFDGHNFVKNVVDQGACAVIVEEQQADLKIPQLLVKDSLVALGEIAHQKRLGFHGRVIAVTGSSGKTSVKGMICSILSEHGQTLATLGNFNNQIGVPLTLMRMKDESYAVVELGTSNPGEIEYLTGLIAPDISVVTNIMPAHIGGFGSLKAIAHEKMKVYQSLNTDKVVINLDDSFSTLFIEQTQNKSRIGYRLSKPETCLFPVVYAQNIIHSETGLSTFDLCFEEDVVSVNLRVPGLHNVSNALAATACVLASGVPLQGVGLGLSKFMGEKGRMIEFHGLNGARIIDDSYNANPGSVMAAIDTLSLLKGRRILVLGDMGELGDDDKALHKKVGSYAFRKGINSLYTCGPLSYFSAESFGENAFSYTTKQALISDLQQELKEGVVVLVKGSRSARMEEIIPKISVSQGGFEC